MSDSSDPNSATGQRTQEKLEFYVVALTFTILGLSVQTAGFGKSVTADILELLSWLALLVSGVVGLWRLEGKPFFYHLVSLKNEFDARAKGIRKIEAAGERSVFSLEVGRSLPTEEVLANAVNSVATIESKLKPWEETLRRRYTAQRWLLVAGFCSLLASRALLPFLSIVDRLRALVAASGA